MAQADLNVANQSGAAFRADLNNQLLALGTLMSGASEPSTTYAYMLWADTTADVLKMRNAANNGWIILRGLEGKLSVGSSAPGANVNLRLNRDIAGATTSFGQYVDANVASSVTGSAIGVGTSLGTAASTSLGSLIHYQAATGTLGAGTSITNQIGFSASSSIDGATNDFGFYGNIAAGSGNWNCYMVGTAPSFFNHQVQIAAGSAGTPAVSTNGDTNTGIYFPAADTLGFVEGGVEAARIDSSGRLLVGTSTAFDATGDALIQAASGNGAFACLGNSDTSVVANENLGLLRFFSRGGSVWEEGARIEAEADLDHASGDKPTRLVFSTTADGASSPTERMRINNGGATSVFGANDVFSAMTSQAAGTSVATFIGRHAATSTTTGTLSFVVWSNGNVVNSNNSYGSLSDLKLKENIVDATSQWNDIKALQVRKYNFKEGQTHTQIGLIAQEVELVSPGLVSESPDRDAEGNDLGTVTKSVNYSVLYMKAVKALQEAMERIETLEAKVAALEGA